MSSSMFASDEIATIAAEDVLLGADPDASGGNLAVAATLRIQWMILTGKLEAGSRLRQEELAAMLGMSVTPVREAFLSLANDGWVTFRRNRGVFVNAMTHDRIVEYGELVELLMEYVVRRAVQRRTPEAVDQLRIAVERLRELRNPAAVWVAFREVRDLVCDMAKAPRAAALLRGTMNVVPTTFTWHISELADLAREACDDLVAGITNGDPPAALRGFRSLLEAGGRHLVTWLEANGVISDA